MQGQQVTWVGGQTSLNNAKTQSSNITCICQLVDSPARDCWRVLQTGKVEIFVRMMYVINGGGIWKEGRNLTKTRINFKESRQFFVNWKILSILNYWQLT